MALSPYKNGAHQYEAMQPTLDILLDSVLWPSPLTRTVRGMQEASNVHHEQHMAGTTKGAVDAHGAGCGERAHHEHQVVRLRPSPFTRNVRGMQEASTVHHEQHMAGTTRGAADAHDAGCGGAHHEHQVVRLRVAEKLRETTATRRVHRTPVGRPRGAADAHDAGLGASDIARHAQQNPVKTAAKTCCTMEATSAAESCPNNAGHSR